MTYAAHSRDEQIVTIWYKTPGTVTDLDMGPFIKEVRSKGGVFEPISFVLKGHPPAMDVRITKYVAFRHTLGDLWSNTAAVADVLQLWTDAQEAA